MSEQHEQNHDFREQASDQPDDQNASSENTWTEKIDIASSEALASIKSLIREGNVRRVTIKNSNGRVLLSVPVTAGVAIGGVAVLAVPTVAAIAALTALVSKVTLEIERTDDDPTPHFSEPDETIIEADIVNDSER